MTGLNLGWAASERAGKTTPADRPEAVDARILTQERGLLTLNRDFDEVLQKVRTNYATDFGCDSIAQILSAAACKDYNAPDKQLSGVDAFCQQKGDRYYFYFHTDTLNQNQQAQESVLCMRLGALCEAMGIKDVKHTTRESKDSDLTTGITHGNAFFVTVPVSELEKLDNRFSSPSGPQRDADIEAFKAERLRENDARFLEEREAWIARTKPSSSTETMIG